MKINFLFGILILCFCAILTNNLNQSIKFKDTSSCYFELDDFENKMVSLDVDYFNHSFTIFVTKHYHINYFKKLTKGFFLKPIIPPEYSCS